MKRLARIIAAPCGVAIVLHLAAPAWAETSVMYSGLAFRGNASEVKERYPYALALANEDGKDGQRLSLFRTLLLETAKKSSPPNYTIKFEGGQDLDKGQGLVLALALDRESISIEKFPTEYKVLVDINAQLTIFNYEKESRSVAATFPIVASGITTSEGEPSPETISELVRRVIVGPPLINGTTIISEFKEALDSYPVKRHYKLRVGVTEVGIEPGAESSLPTWAKEAPNTLKLSLAQMFSRYLSRNQKLSVVPYGIIDDATKERSKDGAIGGSMTVQFANGDIDNFQLPDPDFGVTLDLTGFKKVLYSETAAEQSWIYGAYVTVAGIMQSRGKVYMDVPFKQGLTRQIPTTQASIQDWPTYYEVLNELMNGLTAELTEKPNKKWIKSHTQDKRARKQMQAFAEKLEKCR